MYLPSMDRSQGGTSQITVKRVIRNVDSAPVLAHRTSGERHCYPWRLETVTACVGAEARPPTTRGKHTSPPAPPPPLLPLLPPPPAKVRSSAPAVRGTPLWLCAPPPAGRPAVLLRPCRAPLSAGGGGEGREERGAAMEKRGGGSGSQRAAIHLPPRPILHPPPPHLLTRCGCGQSFGGI